MKRGNRIGLLSGLLGCISLAAFGVGRYEEQKEIIRNSDEIILEVAGDEVKTLSWECATGSFAFHRDEDGAWLYDTDEAFPVDGEKIGELLEPFEEFGVSFIIEEAEDQEQYGLDDPVCTIRMETEEETYEILLGDYSVMDSERYVSVGDGSVYLVKNDPLESFEIEIGDVIRQDEIPVPETIIQLQASGERSEHIFYEEDSTAACYAGDVYFMEQKDADQPLDTDRVKEYLDTVRNLDRTDYVTYDALEEDLAQYGLDTPALTLVLDYATSEEETREETKASFVLSIGRDPAEPAAGHTEGEETSDEDVTAYARIGESD